MGKQKKGLVSSQEEGDTKDNIKGGKRFMLRFELYQGLELCGGVT